MQPNYSMSPYKSQARALNIDAYRQKTGRVSIPDHRSYLTLCNEQPDTHGSEIVQVLETGLIKTKKQFHGVDNDSDIIEENERIHPDAHWHQGDFLSVIEDLDLINPAMIYLDTTGFADHYPATRLVVGTMLMCPPDCMLFANVMLNNPRSASRFNDSKLIQNISRMVPKSVLSKWELEIPSYRYSVTGKTDMKTFILYKRS